MSNFLRIRCDIQYLKNPLKKKATTFCGMPFLLVFLLLFFLHKQIALEKIAFKY